MVPGNIKIDEDGKDQQHLIAVGKHSQVVTANKMLADLLERKSSDPPFNVSGDISNKRKCDANANPTCDEPPTKRSNYTDNENCSNDKKNATKSSSNAVNSYLSTFAASLLEEEDMELEETPSTSQMQSQPPALTQSQQQQQQQSQQQVIPTSVVDQQSKSMITMPMQRQIIVSPNNGMFNLFSQNFICKTKTKI